MTDRLLAELTEALTARWHLPRAVPADEASALLALMPATTEAVALVAGMLDVMRRAHAGHDIGHRVGAWSHACLGCEMYAAALAATGGDEPRRSTMLDDWKDLGI